MKEMKKWKRVYLMKMDSKMIIAMLASLYNQVGQKTTSLLFKEQRQREREWISGIVV